MEAQSVSIDKSLVVAGRVLSDDKDFLILEVPKDPNRELVIREGDQFLTMAFMKPDRATTGAAVPWLPWES